MNFLDIQPGAERSNQWRNIVTIGVLVLALSAGVFLYAGIHVFPQPVSSSAAKHTVASIHTNKEKVGGDVTVAPPVSTSTQLPVLHGVMLSSTQFSATSIIVKDEKTGAVLFSKNPFEVRPIASITKLISALVLLDEKPDWNATTTVVGRDLYGVHIYPGQVYTNKQLWQAMLVASSNRAIFSLAKHATTSTSNFVTHMNEKAHELGMNHSSFTDSTGLVDGDVSTASDVAILLKNALQHPEIQKELETRDATIIPEGKTVKVHMWNTDWLLLGWIPSDFAYFYGGKTGFIDDSLYNFAVQLGDSKGHIIDVVVLGAKDNKARFTEARDIADWVFTHYTWPKNAISVVHVATSTTSTLH